MFLKGISLATVLTLVLASGNKWAWKNVAEPQCNKCKCYKGPQMELKPLRSMFAERRFVLMASKLRLASIHVGLGNRGMIKTDQDLDAFSALTFKAYFSKNMKRAYTNWTLDETVTGSFVASIRGNVYNYKYETGTSRKILGNEDSLVGDRFVNAKVIWADETCMLFVFCFGSEGYSGWALDSTSRTLSKRTKNIVYGIISARGFSAKKAVVIPY